MDLWSDGIGGIDGAAGYGEIVERRDLSTQLTLFKV